MPARTGVGVASLPVGADVEIECIANVLQRFRKRSTCNVCARVLVTTNRIQLEPIPSQP
jgi:hypothetical protein